MENKTKTQLIIPQKLVLLQKEDKELQKEQNRILVQNTKLTIWATIFGGLAMLFQLIQVFTDIIIYKLQK